MRTERYSSNTLKRLIQQHKIVAMPELKEALGTQIDVTVFRKLAELGYRTSYSHRGRYYTLEQIPTYDEWGLWSYRSVHFSVQGTLRATAKALVEESEAGFFATELETLLHVEVKGSLRTLVEEKELCRESVCGRYLYCSRDPSSRKSQIAARKIYESQPTLTEGLIHDDIMPDELKAAIVLFFSLLDERQRRLYAGLESLKLGHGGDQRIADLFNLDRSTVAKGRKELVMRDSEIDERLRKPGGGRKPQEKKHRTSSRESTTSCSMKRPGIR